MEWVLRLGEWSPGEKRGCNLGSLTPRAWAGRSRINGGVNRSLFGFRGIPAGSAHDSILSRNGVSGNPGAVQRLTFVVDDTDVIERAIDVAKRQHGLGTRGKALVAIASAYLTRLEASK